MVVCVLGLIIAEYIRPDYYIVADGKKWEVDACGGEVVIEFNTNIPENRRRRSGDRKQLIPDT